MARALVTEWRDEIHAAVGLDHTARLLAHELAWYMNGAGACWPSRAELARVLGADVRTVERATQRLEEARLVAVRRGCGRGHPNTYLAIVNGVTAAAVPESGRAAAVPPFQVPKGRQTGPERAAPAPPGTRRTSEEQRAPGRAPEGGGTLDEHLDEALAGLEVEDVGEGQARGEGWLERSARDPLNAGDPDREVDELERTPAYQAALERQRAREARWDRDEAAGDRGRMLTPEEVVAAARAAAARLRGGE